jgi:hypothetical protein
VEHIMRTLRPTSLAATLSLSSAILVVSAGWADASTTGPRGEQPWPAEAEMSATANATATQQNSASAWAETNGDHGITVTTTRSGDSTSCMVVEWKRENGVVKKWQYRCDAGQP